MAQQKKHKARADSQTERWENCPSSNGKRDIDREMLVLCSLNFYYYFNVDKHYIYIYRHYEKDEKWPMDFASLLVQYGSTIPAPFRSSAMQVSTTLV